MGDWEDEDAAPAPIIAPVKGQWDDEDVEEEAVKESWDASDDEGTAKATAAPSKAASTKASAPQPKKKMTLAQKIAERTALEQRKKEEAMQKIQTPEQEDVDEFAGESLAERKKREEQTIREADLENAKDLFGVNEKPQAVAGYLDITTPSTKAEYDAYHSRLLKKLSTFESSAHFAAFVENLMRDLCVSLSVDDIKRISSSLNILANEKQKATKGPAAKKKPAAKKVALKAGPSAGNDLTNYDDAAYDDDDFM